MTNKPKFATTVLATLLVFILCASAHGMNLLTCDEPPMNYLVDGKVTGIVTDIVKEISTQTGADDKIKLLPWARAYAIGLNEANIVLFTAARTQKREKLFHWVGPVIKKRWVLFARQDSNITIEKMDDAKKVNFIGVMRKDARESFLKIKGFENLYLLNSHDLALKMLIFKRIDLFASSDIELLILSQKLNIRQSQVKNACTLKNIESYILISKATPKHTVRLWQNTFEIIKEDGTFSKIGEKWARALNIPLTGENGVMEISNLN